MRRYNQRGQALLIVVTALGILLLGALGLAIDGAQLYAHRQMAQNAADAAAQAGVLSMFNGTNTGGNAFGSAAFNCTTTSTLPPCVYARQNGFGKTADDVVHVDFPTSATGVSLSSDYPVNLIRVSVTRPVPTTLIGWFGKTSSTIGAAATAAIVDVLSPVPILVLHPNKSGAFAKNGTNDVIICGGPNRSIQVNSSSATSITVSGVSGTVDLRHAGPDATPGNCDGSGADFGDWGGPHSYPGTLVLGTKGRYIQPASIINDPLIHVVPPAQPVQAGSYVVITPHNGAHGCPAALPSTVECRVYSPGFYNAGIDLGQSNKVFALFRPGIYYINHGGFHLNSNSIVRMAIAPDNSDPTLLTTWTQGMLIYNSPATPVNTSKDIIEITSNAGQIQNVTYPDIATGCPDGGNCLVGSPLNSAYKSILFFQDRHTATTLTHILQGGGGLTVRGTVYLTHTATATLSDAMYQALNLQGTSGSSTKVIGEIIADTLSLGGTSQITMVLDPNNTLHVSQVALVE